MGKTTITGASDDLIEIDGELSVEFSAYMDDNDEHHYLGFSDGTMLSVKYDSDGIWRFNLIAQGSCKMTKVDGCVEKDTFDVVTLEGDLKWVILGTEKALRK